MSIIYDFMKEFKGMKSPGNDFYKRVGRFETFFNDFNKKPMYEDAEECVRLAIKDGNMGLIEDFVLNWMMVLAENYRSNRFDGRNEMACRKCNELLTALNRSTDDVCDLLMMHMVNNFHRTLCQTATYVLLYCVYVLEKKDNSVEDIRVFHDIFGEDIEYSLKHVPLI